MIGLTVEVGLILEPAGWISFVRFAMPQTTFFQSSKSPQSSTGHRSDGEEEAKGLQLYGYWLWGCVTGESFNCRKLSIACLFVWLVVCLVGCLFVWLVVCLFVCLFVCLLACLFVCLFVRVFVPLLVNAFFLFTVCISSYSIWAGPFVLAQWPGNY